MHLRHYGIDDAYDLDAMFVVYDDYENIFGKFSFGETFEFTDSGKYFVKAVNRFGKSLADYTRQFRLLRHRPF